ncbi:MAG: tetraacyldisaccharide 4'-kinase [Caldimicrobium sp.]
MLPQILNPYYWAISLRNFLYDKGIKKTKSLPCFVISVGNISCGGTGKTSLIKYLAETLSMDYKVGILLRGYKRESKGFRWVLKEGQILSSLAEVGDEAFMLANLLKEVPNITLAVCEDRFTGGLILHKEAQIQILLLDDGFQHRKLTKDIDLVLLKKNDLEDTLLPFGKLREPLKVIKRADAIILTYQEIAPFDFSYENKPIFKLFRKNWKILNDKKQELINWKDYEFIAFCGLGDNEQFLKTLSSLQIKVKKFISLPDHYSYKNFKLHPEEKYLTTYKDYIKLSHAPNLYYLNFQIEIPHLYEFITSHLTLPSKTSIKTPS